MDKHFAQMDGWRTLPHPLPYGGHIIRYIVALFSYMRYISVKIWKVVRNMWVSLLSFSFDTKMHHFAFFDYIQLMHLFVLLTVDVDRDARDDERQLWTNLALFYASWASN